MTTMLLLLALGASSMMIMFTSDRFVDVVVHAFQQTPMVTTRHGHQHHPRYHHYSKRTSPIVQLQQQFLIDGLSHQNLKKTTMVFSTPNESGDDEDPDISSSSSPSAVVVEDDESSQPYPIDLPSPLLLASSMVLAIVGTGMC